MIARSRSQVVEAIGRTIAFSSERNRGSGTSRNSTRPRLTNVNWRMGIQHDVRGQRLTVWPCAGTAPRLGAEEEPLIRKADARSAMLNRATYKGSSSTRGRPVADGLRKE